MLKNGAYSLILLCLLVRMQPVHAETLLTATSSWDGGSIEYPQGKAEIHSVKLVIPAGETTAFHCHPIPTLGYVLKGTIEVETAAGKKARFSAGESVVEVMRTAHRGHAPEGGVEIIVFYAGAASIPTTVLPDDDPGNEFCAGDE